MGYNTPSIIRFPFEKMCLRFKDTTLIRVNDKYLDMAFEIQDKAMMVHDDCGSFIKGLLNS